VSNADSRRALTHTDTEPSYTYTITFSGLIVGVANLANYWAISAGLKSTIFAIAPISLVVLNLLWVEVSVAYASACDLLIRFRSSDGSRPSEDLSN